MILAYSHTQNLGILPLIKMKLCFLRVVTNLAFQQKEVSIIYIVLKYIWAADWILWSLCVIVLPLQEVQSIVWDIKTNLWKHCPILNIYRYLVVEVDRWKTSERRQILLFKFFWEPQKFASTWFLEKIKRFSIVSQLASHWVLWFDFL